MHLFLDETTHRYSGSETLALAGVSLFVRSGEIAAVVGPPGACKSTLLRADDGVFIGSADHRKAGAVRPDLIRGWRFCEGIPTPARGTDEWRFHAGMPVQ